MEQLILVFTVFVGGITSFLLPCILPLVPAYLTYLGGSSYEELKIGNSKNAVRRRAIVSSVFFVLGFGTVFVTFGVAISYAAGWVDRELFERLAGVIIFIFGLHFIGLFKLTILQRTVQFQGPRLASGPIGGYVFGLSFGLGWTPCIGPVLGSVLGVVGTRETVVEGVILMVMYVVGLGVPFVFAAFAIKPFLRFFDRFKYHMGKVEIGMGIVLIITGLLFFFNEISALSNGLLGAFPGVFGGLG